MFRSQTHFDWRQMLDDRGDDPVTSGRGRLPWVLAFFAVALATVFARAVQLEMSDGENFRRIAATPLERSIVLRAPRGRILARDGTVLAADRQTRALAIRFRYLENPPDARWLRGLARARLSRADRRQAERVAAMEDTVRAELTDLHRRLARLCQVFDEQWQARVGHIQDRVHALSAHVNARRLERYRQSAVTAIDGEFTWMSLVAGLFAPPEQLPPAPVTVAEEAAYHRLVDDVPPAMAAQIEAQFAGHPGVQLVEYSHRDYPLQSLAAHVVGYVSAGSDFASIVTSPEIDRGVDAAGVMGVERRYESILHSTPGRERQLTDHRGRVLETTRQRDGVPGQDVVLSIDAALQGFAEQSLDRATRKLDQQADGDVAAHSGAIVVMDVRSGELLTAACAPRFDPKGFSAADPSTVATLHDARQPLFDRVVKMALPPGSVFKPLTAIALLESRCVDPATTFHCQGYLTEPDHLRCQIFRRQGIGHGDVALADALAQSCNVYFFHHVASLGAAPLVDWAARFGFGQSTGIDLPDEAAGRLPTAEELRQANQVPLLAIGQGAFSATPLQVVRMYAAIANGGRLLVPRITRSSVQTAGPQSAANDPDLAQGSPIVGLKTQSLVAVREGLRRVVEDASGTGYASVHLASLAIAGKTGTAQSGGDQEDHAWFAGYAPADEPRYAFVVVLEHAGSGAIHAGSVAKILVQRMQQLGYFGSPQTAEKEFPPGKG